MILETEVENPPPIIDSFTIPENLKCYCDSWGNYNIEPIRIIEQHKETDLIKIIIYNIENNFYYDYQLKINKLILQKKANIKDIPQNTEDRARLAAVDELRLLITEKKIIKTFLIFDKICYNQPELF